MLQSDEASGDDDITFCPSFSSYGCGLSRRRFVFVFVVVGLMTSLLLFTVTATAASAVVVQSLVRAVAAGDEGAAMSV